MKNIISTIDKAPHVVVNGIAFMAMPAYRSKGYKVIPITGTQKGELTEATIKLAFVSKNGGRFRGSRWYK